MILAADEFDIFCADYGVDVVVGGVAQRGIFDNAYAEAFGMVGGSRPMLVVLTSPQAVRGAAVSVGSKGYAVTEAQPDGTGVTTLQLEEAV